MEALLSELTVYAVKPCTNVACCACICNNVGARRLSLYPNTTISLP